MSNLKSSGPVSQPCSWDAAKQALNTPISPARLINMYNDINELPQASNFPMISIDPTSSAKTCKLQSPSSSVIGSDKQVFDEVPEFNITIP
jgi:hypothetical protein